jgi:hypothetical protein
VHVRSQYRRAAVFFGFLVCQAAVLPAPAQTDEFTKRNDLNTLSHKFADEFAAVTIKSNKDTTSGGGV